MQVEAGEKVMADQVADAIADSEEKVAVMSKKLKVMEEQEEPSPSLVFQMQSLRANLRRSRARLGRLRTEQRAAENRD